MPTIIRKVKRINKVNINEKVLAQKYVYNTDRWHKLRISKLQKNPLCEKCLSNDIIKPAVEIHHLTPFMNGSNIEQIKWLGFDYNNLMAVCMSCHDSFHKKE